MAAPADSRSLTRVTAERATVVAQLVTVKAVARQRVALLYLSRRVACRTCFRLAYPSQSEDLMGRMWRKQGKIERRLRSGKRLTSATRERLVDELMLAKDARQAAFIAAARRLLGL
ncbi:hypothetical protein AWB75_02621 [Caballeronia catudaia]|uniref:Uncharacterized protein n=1 Tax=Caballeronia catudaia TaxID=1777136 RepID=A0A158AU66_9BURK|nr:hypothetical protein [Caballeronia catudaia]SAK61394.1 hypothetical protein AWB75_02621 [Caballeronia catudaia]